MMPDTPVEPADVTVVIPAYKAERTIRRAIESVLLDPVVANVIVVIDGALDCTEEVVSVFSSDEVQIVSRTSNLGASRSRNEGLAKVRTKYVMFVDADDFVEGDLIRGLVHTMKVSGADVGFGPMEILYEEENRRLPRRVPDFESPLDLIQKWHLEGLYVNPTSVMWRTEFIRGIQGWDPDVTRNDDGELVIRAVLLGARIAISSQGAGVYVKHSSETLNHRTDNLSSLLAVNEKLLAIKSPWLDRKSQRMICAGHFFNVAWHCYLAGEDELGQEALSRSRQLGYGGSRGPLIYRAAIGALGLKHAVKFALCMRRFGALFRVTH